MTLKKCDLVVIGGGPAGLAAAKTASEGGLKVILLDDSQDLGGHYYKELPVQFKNHVPALQQKVNNELHAYRKALQNRVEMINDTNVWGVFQGDGCTFGGLKDDGDNSLVENRGFSIYAADSRGETTMVEAQALVLAPGVYDRPLPFPGWELPGVLTPGAVQMLLKKQGLLPGKRILVSGTGPLQMIVAAALVESGAEVVALLDTCGLLDGTQYLFSALRGLGSRFAEGLHSLYHLVRNRVPFQFRQAVLAALGSPETGVEAALVTRVDSDGYPVSGTERELQVDTICNAYGFLPAIQLSLHLGCSHHFDPNIWAFVPDFNRCMASSQPGVYLAGDITGVGGKPLAELQGFTAGISVLEQLNYLMKSEADRRRRELLPRIRREEAFSRWLWNRYRLRTGLLEFIEEDTLICRCEGVRYRDLLESLAHGGQDLFGVKLRSRMGMGSCQGRYCMMNAAMLISKETGVPVPQIGTPSVRPPISPTRLDSIAIRD